MFRSLWIGGRGKQACSSCVVSGVGRIVFKRSRARGVNVGGERGL